VIFQTKITHKFNDKTTLNFIGIGAIDDFRSVAQKVIIAEKLYHLNSAPIVQEVYPLKKAFLLVFGI